MLSPHRRSSFLTLGGAPRFHRFRIGCQVIDLGECRSVGFQHLYRISLEHLLYVAIGVSKITKDQGTRRTGVHTGRLQSVFQSVPAELTFLCYLLQRIEISDGVGAGGYAVFAPDAPMRVHYDDAVIELICRSSRTVAQA